MSHLLQYIFLTSHSIDGPLHQAKGPEMAAYCLYNLSTFPKLTPSRILIKDLHFFGMHSQSVLRITFLCLVQNPFLRRCSALLLQVKYLQNIFSMGWIMRALHPLGQPSRYLAPMLLTLIRGADSHRTAWLLSKVRAGDPVI